MSHATSSSTSTSSANFDAIFNSALDVYKKRTKQDLTSHPLLPALQACNSPDAVLAVLREQIPSFSQSRNPDDGVTKWLVPTVNVLLGFSAALGEGVGLALPPAKVIFAGVGVLLLTAKDVHSRKETLIGIFSRVEYYFKRLEIYTSIPTTAAMRGMMMDIMVEVISFLAIATKEVKRGRTKKYLKRLLGNTEVEDALQRLDRLTLEEAHMAAAELLRISHNVESGVIRVDEGVQGVGMRVQNVGDKVEGVDSKVQDVNSQVKKVGGTVQNVDKNVQEIGDMVNDVGDRVQDIRKTVQGVDDKVDQVNRNHLRERLQSWLSPPDPSTNHNIACDAQHEGTAQWFFRGSIFNQWKASGPFLWIHGKPGAGKSILCSAIIRDIMTLRESGHASFAYFYFDFRDSDKQRRRNLLPSLLIQLAAIDECPNTSGIPSPRKEVLEVMNELVALGLPNLHICVTSRPEIDIQTVLQPLTPHPVSLHDETGQKQDIIDYVTSVVHSNNTMRRWRNEDKELVIKTLSEKANGMFRWVFCQLELLCQAFPSSVRHILDELPESLDMTYERILKEIGKPNQKHAYRLLQCLVAAVRPLRVKELAEVLAVDFGAGGTPLLNPGWRWSDQQEAVLSACSSLVMIVEDGDSRIVQFSHFSVQEYLMSSRLAESSKDVSQYHIQLEPAHAVLAQACLGVLLRLDTNVDRKSIKNFPLARYAARYWVDHAQFGNVSSQIEDGMDCLFDVDKPHFATWLWIFNEDHIPHSFLTERPSKPEAVPLYHAALHGFRDVAERLLAKHPEDINAKNHYDLTPLYASAYRQHYDVFSLLIDHFPVVDTPNGSGLTSLHLAAWRGLLEIGKRLLSRRADVNARDDLGRTPFYVAVELGQLDFARMLLEHDALIDTQVDDGETLLHWASQRGYVETVQFLLENGANTSPRNNDGETPLHQASRFGYVETVQLLLENGANISARNDGGTPSEVASNRGYPEVARLISEYGRGSLKE